MPHEDEELSQSGWVVAARACPPSPFVRDGFTPVFQEYEDAEQWAEDEIDQAWCIVPAAVVVELRACEKCGSTDSGVIVFSDHGVCQALAPDGTCRVCEAAA